MKSNFSAGQCQQEQLTVNYRSTPEIIGVYNRWIADEDWSEAGKTFRFGKEITARPAKFPETASVLRLRRHFPDGPQEKAD